MKIHISKNIIENIIKIAALICLVVLLVQLHSFRDNQFRYHYVEGRPWAYEELQAPFDFPIYKSETAIEEERTEALKNFFPCFNIKSEAYLFISDSLRQSPLYTNALSRFSNSQINNAISELNGLLNTIYSVGIISAEDLSWLTDSNYVRIKIIDPKRVARDCEITSCYTSVSAYTYIRQCLSLQQSEILEALDFHRFISSNLTYNPTLSSNLRTELLTRISLTEGRVQHGERIIDRGEIVTPQKYKILNSLASEYDKIYSSGLTSWSIVGDILLISFFIVLLVLYLINFRPKYFDGMKNMLFFTLLIGTMVALSVGAIRLGEVLDLDMCVYIVPIAWIPILIRIFYDARTGLYIHWITVMLVALMTNDPFTYIFIQVAVGMVVVSSLKDVSERSQLARTALYVLITYALTYTALTLSVTGDINKLEWLPYVLFAANSLLLLLAYGLIFICEKTFKMLSSMTLVELSNVNSDLMLQLAEKAPGTFQHSLQVANLATEAAKQIGADSLLVRTGAMYHDIGKMACPQNFTENQVGGANPLLEMTPLEAAAIVINHVNDGILMAGKEHLPQQIIDFIITHHGTSKVKYFYNTYCNAHPDEKVDDSMFSYPGPRPFTREQGILMMADAVEARSRSLSEYTEQSIDEMVEIMVATQVNEGQLKNTPLTFKDIEDIKSVFKEKLRNIYHHRIAYPELKK